MNFWTFKQRISEVLNYITVLSLLTFYFYNIYTLELYKEFYTGNLCEHILEILLWIRFYLSS